MRSERLFFLLLFVSASSLSANDNATLSCTPDNINEDIIINSIDISPSTKIGQSLNTVVVLERDVGKCKYNGDESISRLSPQPFVRYDAPDFISSNVYPGVTYDFGDITCPVYKTEHDGIGISWANYNSGALTWMCINHNMSRGLPTFSDATNKIKDIVVFVRTSKSVETGSFKYGKELKAFYTAGINSDTSKKIGYNINVVGNGEVKLGECNIESGSKTVMLNSVTLKSISNNPSNSAPLLPNNKIAIDIICKGFRKDGENFAYYKVLSDSYYDNNNKFAKSKDGNLGVSLNNGTVIDYDKPIKIDIVDVPNSIDNEARGKIVLTPSLYAKISDLKKIMDTDEPKVEIKIEPTILGVVK